VENKKRYLALELIRRAFDRNHDGQLDAQERANVRLIIYGQSFGGAAVVKLARELERMGAPVLLTVQVDSVGRGDRIIPTNVARAANLFQRNGLFIRGEPEVHAQDQSRTEIIGNFEFDYRNKKIDLSEESRMKRLFRVAHTKMDFDPAVWSLVEELIVKEIKRLDDERHN
jgi:thioesterase domain-containing protein